MKRRWAIVVYLGDIFAGLETPWALFSVPLAFASFHVLELAPSHPLLVIFSSKPALRAVPAVLSWSRARDHRFQDIRGT
ncbi:hypothetical protein PAXRUDRAFT_822670 [Paxillus rubicundulus Ve08.2h10]|uniref:Uncharacterized protein n=1 Tax=Paxillus rubicundulus Ve08.2h10 TaxID=930991 RepID=A0A0D0DW87_9AGAM|nr:hypothetical protein PAXRUDRAFT_822670 [Paxillus rubicundulus Ve08.2h10]